MINRKGTSDIKHFKLISLLIMMMCFLYMQIRGMAFLHLNWIYGYRMSIALIQCPCIYLTEKSTPKFCRIPKAFLNSTQVPFLMSLEMNRQKHGWLGTQNRAWAWQPPRSKMLERRSANREPWVVAVGWRRECVELKTWHLNQALHLHRNGWSRNRYYWIHEN